LKLAALAAALAVASSASAAARPWQPSMGAAVAYASHRHGEIAFAVRTPTRSWSWHGAEIFPSASVLKAMLLVAYLDLPSVRARALEPADRALLAPMIRRSDNAAAGRVLGIVGAGRLRVLAHRAGMRRFTPVTGIWGLSRIDAVDQARYFLRIDSLLAPRHRAYAMRLLNTITPAQRWGLARVRPAGWRLYFKGGWGSGTGWVDHQVALLTRGNERVSVAILTHLDGSHPYGEETLRGIALRLLKGL
jgi:beta-lactamase family protein